MSLPVITPLSHARMKLLQLLSTLEAYERRNLSMLPEELAGLKVLLSDADSLLSVHEEVLLSASNAIERCLHELPEPFDASDYERPPRRLPAPTEEAERDWTKR